MSIIDLFSSYILFFQYTWSCHSTQESNKFLSNFVLFTCICTHHLWKKQTNKQTKSQVLLGPPLGKQNIQGKEAYYAAYLLNLLKYVSVKLLRYHVQKTLFVFLIVVRQLTKKIATAWGSGPTWPSWWRKHRIDVKQQYCNIVKTLPH